MNKTTFFYYMAESLSRQDEVYPAFWLATWEGKPPWISCVGPSRKSLDFGHDP